MDHSAATGHTHSPRIKSANSEKSIVSSSHCVSTPSASGSVRENEEDQVQLQWAAIERLPTFQRLRFSLLDDSIGGSSPASTDVRVKRVIDVAKLGALERHAFIEKLIKNVENDNRHLLQKLRERTDK